MRFHLTLSLVLTLTACGFSLRGSQPATLPFTALTVNLQQENGLLARSLRATLETYGVSVIPLTAAEISTPYALSLSEETLDIRPVSVTGRASAAQYLLSTSAEFSVHDQQGVLILGPEILNVQRTYFEDIANIAGSTSEIDLLRMEMRQDLSEQLLRRMQAITAGN